MRWKLNQILSTKAFSIVFSILAAIALWAYVDSQQGEDSSVLVQDVAVIFEGGQELEAKDMVMTAADTDKVSLRFTGDRNVITRLNNANLTVTVNLADIVSSTSGTYQLLYEVQYPEGLNVRTVKVTERSADYVGVTVEKRLQKSIVIRASYDGDIAQGYSAEPLVLEQDTVVISGSQALVSKVDHAEVRFTVDNLDKTMTRQLSLQLVDAAGAPVSQEGLTLSRDTVQVTFFPHADPEDFGISYDAAAEKVLYEARGRRAKKREQALMETLRTEADALAAELGGSLFWEQPLIEARLG